MARRKPTAAQLDALRTSLNEGRVTELPLELVEPDPGQPRRTFDDVSLNDLAHDIKVNGVLQPITVDHTDKGWQIVMGERRWRAAVACALKTIPALLVPPTVPDSEDASRWQLDRRLRQFAENHHREPLPPMDLAYFLRSLRDDLGLSASQIAASLKDRGVREMGRSYVSNTIRLTELPKGYQRQIADGDLAPSHGKYILMLEALGETGYEAFDQHLATERQYLADGERVTAREVQIAVKNALDERGYRIDEHAPLDQSVVDELEEEGLPYADGIVFDRAQCKSCPKRQAFTNYRGQQQIWCLDRDAFLEKQRVALTAIQGGAPVPEGVEVELDLLPAADDADAPAGVIPPGPDYTTPDQREETLRRKVHDHLVEWMRPRLVERFRAESVECSIAFVLWAALSFPRALIGWDKTPQVDCMQPWQMSLNCRRLASELRVDDPLHAGDLRDHEVEGKVRAYVDSCVQVIDAQVLWRWVIALGIDTLSGYDLTQGYFECCDKAEVEILARELGVYTSSSATKGKMVAAIVAAKPEHVPERVSSVLDEVCMKHKEAVVALDALIAGHAATSEDSEQQAAA